MKTKAVHDVLKTSEVEAVLDREEIREYFRVNDINESFVVTGVASQSLVTPLAFVATKSLHPDRRGHVIEVMRDLIALGADVNAPVQRLGYFADGYSGGEGHDLADVVYGADRIELLIKNGASAKEKHIHCLFQEGENGAFIAGNYFDLIKPRHFAQLNNRHGSSSIIDELALSGFNFNAQDRNGDTALAFVRDIQNVKRLVDAGASLTIPNVSGETFLDQCNGDFVHRNSSHEGVKIMKDLGIDLNAKDAFSKNTALHRLMILGNNVAAISDLLDAGADPTVRNGENKLPTEMGFPGADRREALMLMESVISKKNLLNELGETCQQPIMRRKM
ncbi:MULTISPECIES: hypothetical protein [Stenotrophomonas]|uniref:hypothetical protein n=1 Tax=Stenotrophomonas TaxID=40323 RepID=UPI00114C8E2D|nr:MULTISPECIES: hypothetical protein [Stenotrophomonas]